MSLTAEEQSGLAPIRKHSRPVLEAPEQRENFKLGGEFCGGDGVVLSERGIKMCFGENVCGKWSHGTREPGKGLGRKGP